MNPYKGIIRISCNRKKECVKVKARKNVQPACLNCPEAVTEVLDLDEKVLFKYQFKKKVQGAKGSRSRAKR